jgi:heat shock protein HslJ
MSTQKLRRPFLFVLLLALAACAQKPEVRQVSTATLPPLAGTLWRAESVGGAGIIDNALVTAAFEAGEVSGSAGCNTFRGSYAQQGAALKLGPLATTRRACAPALMDLEARYLAILAGVSSGAIDVTGALVLKAVDGRSVLLRRTEAPAAAVVPAGGSLEGGPWYADGFAGDASGAGRAEITFEGGDQGTSRVYGTGGCNRFSGSWKQDGARITLGPLASSMMACPQPQMDAEARFFKLLGGATTVSVAGNVATLTTADGQTLVLRRAN